MFLGRPLEVLLGFALPRWFLLPVYMSLLPDLVQSNLALFSELLMGKLRVRGI